MLPTIEGIYHNLYRTYGPQYWWPADTPFEMMIGAILVQNTAWTNVEKALDQLKDHLDPRAIHELSDQELESMIRPSGFYRMKTQRIRAFLSWYEMYDYDPKRLASKSTKELRQELLHIKGIGSETADSILLYAFNRHVFVIDAYTKRIFNRIGFDLDEKYEAIQQFFEMHLPKKVSIYNEYHALIVEHAKRFCKTKPLCEQCPIRTSCRQLI
ncbi:DNA-3-methyladenine glycosylase III [Pelagirhabdus alkalitolerans]|uniref:DNA-3-methyladenine glycosylase III n=1 Tax=Pelagirhabdus alkalitolerans TaxID=1612202 RepID=A0A1G6JUE8_9BACI|nr:endonuclease III domain-containing protein [Pelagirhabdus alkalitolerans]SDC22288.1 DNA-3-methyladenine glycosylase III [Pelagirhabdus alkalitolerans]